MREITSKSPSRRQVNIEIQRKKSINVPATQIVMDIVNKLIMSVKTKLTKLKTNQTTRLQDKLSFRILQLKTVAETSLEGAMNANPDDIFYQNLNSEQWQRLAGHYSVVVSPILNNTIIGSIFHKI